MLHDFPLYLAIVIFIILLIMLSQRIKVAYPIVLVLAGLAISLIPKIPPIHINHELIFFIFLPPLLYEAAWDTSWKEFWRFRRFIGSFAFIIVLLTSLVVAWVASSIIPGFSLALGFLLGGIVSPPDAVSASAIMKLVRVPKYLKAIIEGESLINDAASLIVFRFALIAVDTGRFVFWDATASFFWVILAGIAIGLAVAYVFYQVRKLLPTDDNMHIVFMLVTPYVIYLTAETFHVSGVLGVVSGGLFLSSRRHSMMSSSSRLGNSVVLSALGFVLNGLVFILIGLQLPGIVAGLGDVSLKLAIFYGLIISLVLILGRLLSVFGAVLFTRFAGKYVATAGNPRTWKGPFLFGWAGMRGVVSLAAALSIPSVLSSTKMPFPERSLILFITFVVILVTLVMQGLTLPFFIKKLHPNDFDEDLSEEDKNKLITQKLAEHTVDYIRTSYSEQLDTQPAVQRLIQSWENKLASDGNKPLNPECKSIYLDVINKQRDWLHKWNKDIKIDEETIRQQLRKLDLEEEELKYA